MNERIINGIRCTYHHTAAAKGYISWKNDERIEEYNGKFGRGFKVCKPRYDTTNYYYIKYWIAE